VKPHLLLAIGASAGGVEALTEAVAGLPADLPASVLVTVHIGEQARSRLPEILARSGPLPAGHARHGEQLRPGRIYVAPPGYHLLAIRGVAQLSRGPMVNRHRPAVDVMFASAARWADGRTVAAVLSGMLDDGAVGAALVARAGGRVLVQEPTEAMFDPMPRAALAAVPDAIPIPAGRLGSMAVTLIDPESAPTAADGGAGVMPRQHMEDSDDPLFLADDESRLTRMSCPECSGTLAQIDLPRISYYRCHVGHQYSPQTLESTQRELTEAKLWTAIAALEEHAALARHLANQPGGDHPSAAQYLRTARESADLAKSMRAELTPVAEPAGVSSAPVAEPAGPESASLRDTDQ
jgi:two-component system chemotaxis response regulator CheB